MQFMLMPAFHLEEVILLPFFQLRKQIFLNNPSFDFEKIITFFICVPKNVLRL